MRKTSKELLEERGVLAQEIQKLADLTNGDDSREFTGEETEKWEKVNKAYDATTRQIKAAEIRELGGEICNDLGVGRDDYDGSTDSENGPYGRGLAGGMYGSGSYEHHGTNRAHPRPVEWYNGESGREVRCFAPNEPVSPDNDLSIARIACAIVTGRKSYLQDPEHRALEGISDIAGGVWLGTPVAAKMIDLARANSVAIAAGIQTVIMDERELSMVKIDSSASAQWLEENVAATDSTPTFGRVVLRSKTLRAEIPVSEEILQDSPNAASEIEKEFRRMLGEALDKAILTGGSDGLGGPTGLRNLTSVQEITGVAVPSYNDFSLALEKVRTNNAPTGLPVSAILHPRDLGVLDRIQDSTGQPLRPPESWQKMTKFDTTAISITEGGGSDESFSIVGPFGSAILGMRLRARIKVEPGTAGKFQKRIVAVLRADFVAPRPEFFVRLLAITTT